MATSLNGSRLDRVRDRRTRAGACSTISRSRRRAQWKAASPDRKVVGYMPIYVPREIIHAAGMLPLGIVGGGDQLEVIHGDAYYQSYICRIPRSTIELGVTGRLDFVDGMLFPSICDVIRNLSGMWKMMFPKVYVRYFDVPQNYKDEIGGNYYVNELAELRDALGGVARQADHRRRAAPLDRGLQRKPPAGARALRLPRAEAVADARPRKSICCCAPAWCCRSKQHTRHAARLSRRGGAARSGRGATIAASCSPACSASSRRSI